MSLDFSSIYLHDAMYAREHGEMDQYFASRKANIACKKSIEQALSQHYGDNRLSTIKAAQDVIGEWGVERVTYVLAATIRQLDWDQRISRTNKAWARTIPVVNTRSLSGPYSAYCQVSSHSGLVDMLTTEVQHQARQREPLTTADIEQEADRLLKKLREADTPNSPDGKHYMAEIHHDFLYRANSKDIEQCFFSFLLLGRVGGI